MEILNLYSGLGGNRLLWGNSHNITAIEINKSVAIFYKSKFPNDKIIVTDAHKYLLNNYGNFDFIWSSIECFSHSKARYWRSKGKVIKPIYPDLKLYEEILFLKYYFEGGWVVENTKPYYNPLIDPISIIGRHLFWANFRIPRVGFDKSNPVINKGVKKLEKYHGFNLDKYKFTIGKEKLLRNIVHPEIGLYILDCYTNSNEFRNYKKVKLPVFKGFFEL